MTSDWISIDRERPPSNVPVEVLFADGVVCTCAFAGFLPIMKNGMYRYVDPKFWRVK